MEHEKDKNQSLCSHCQSSAYAQLDQVLEELKDTPGNLIIILQKAQEIFGYLPRDVIRRISAVTGPLGGMSV